MISRVLITAAISLCGLFSVSTAFVQPNLKHFSRKTQKTNVGSPVVQKLEQKRSCTIREKSMTPLVNSALLDPYIISTALSTSSALTADASTSSLSIFTPENIKTAFSVATFLPQPFWVLLILFPNASFTKKIMGEYGMQVITIFALVHFFIVFSSILQPDGTAPLVEFNDVFDPSGDPQSAMMGMMKYRNFVSEEWSHVLTWDLFVGRWIWMDGLKKGGDDTENDESGGVFTGVSVLFCNLIGPPGFLIHVVTSLLSGKGFPGNYDFAEEE